MIASLLGALLASCGDGPNEVDDPCMISTLPLTGSAGAPTITDVGLEIQTSDVVVVATATDPQGSANLTDVLQSVGVFPDARCEGAPIVLRDDLVGSGIEETFGTAVERSTDPALYDAIASAVRWPVLIDFHDQDANRTTGRVMARIIR